MWHKEILERNSKIYWKCQNHLPHGIFVSPKQGLQTENENMWRCLCLQGFPCNILALYDPEMQKIGQLIKELWSLGNMKIGGHLQDMVWQFLATFCIAVVLIFLEILELFQLFQFFLIKILQDTWWIKKRGRFSNNRSKSLVTRPFDLRAINVVKREWTVVCVLKRNELRLLRVSTSSSGSSWQSLCNTWRSSAAEMRPFPSRSMTLKHSCKSSSVSVSFIFKLIKTMNSWKSIVPLPAKWSEDTDRWHRMLHNKKGEYACILGNLSWREYHTEWKVCGFSQGILCACSQKKYPPPHRWISCFSTVQVSFRFRFTPSSRISPWPKHNLRFHCNFTFLSVWLSCLMRWMHAASLTWTKLLID